ncbi:hypothetical protein KFL_006650050 [Klebsormidium nitens]|uniref:Histidine kinase n=1 Tax=Klebsormidium nitens TaxID=105231 RepID=A0A1Y1IN85_KLENI|nr:hypothetical protein KFL_006650050 [Klebsormidium nitens]|eukprot:GAQ90631.1 hypothetical protein KFL_006650050 [Klebsormidium nitens]
MKTLGTPSTQEAPPSGETLQGSRYFTSAGFQSASNLSLSFVRTGNSIIEYTRNATDAPNITGYEVSYDSGRASPIPTNFIATPPLQYREWYVRAVAQQDRAIVTPLLSVLGYPTVIVSYAISDSTDTLRGAVNLGLDVSFVLSTLASRNRTDFSTTYVTIRQSGDLLPLTQSPNFTQFVNAYNSTDPFVSESARKLGNALYDEKDYNLQIRLRGRRYFVGVKKLLNNVDLTMVVLMPRDYFFARVDHDRTVTIGVFCAAMALWAVFALVVSIAFFRLRKRERILRAAAKHEEEQHKLKQILLTRLSHELRTPMTVVMGLLEELQNDCKQEDLMENVNLLKKTSIDMLHLLDGILVLAKNEAGKTNVEKQLFDLKAELKAALAAIAPLLTPQGVTTSLKYDEHMAKEFVGDRRVLRQILDNLLNNAAKFTDHGRIEIEVAGNPVKTDDRLLGGDITVDSSSSQGTCFRFSVSLGVPSASIRRSEVVSETMKNDDSPLEGIRVLVAEDTRLISKILERFLLKEGARATMSEDGKAALDIYCERPFDYDIILMDLQMPRLDGYEATRQIRKLETDGALPGRVPIVALTAHAMENDAIKCREVGMNDYIRKPISRETMLSTILSLARSKRLSSSRSNILNP